MYRPETICDILKKTNINFKKTKTRAEIEVDNRAYTKTKTKADTRAEIEAEIEAETNNLYNTDMGLNVAAYIYTIENETIYIGCVRKGYDGCRSYSSKDGKRGAAGTNEKYWGKWTNIGGSKNKGGRRKNSISNFNAIIEEINDECGIEDHKKINKTNNNVNINLKYLKSNVSDPKHLKLTLNYCKDIGHTIIFIFNMPDKLFFKHFFPKRGNTSQNLFRRSEGEIDAKKSFTLKNIYELWNRNLRSSNYFIKYFITNLKKIFIPYLNNLKINKTQIEYINSIKYENIKNNVHKRTPPKEEIPHDPYIR